jgi:glycosyltransferase involved in cell wall biosynthesis
VVECRKCQEEWTTSPLPFLTVTSNERIPARYRAGISSIFPYNRRGGNASYGDELLVTDRPTILYAGTYERDYPRNQQLIRLLRQNGCSVVEIHSPYWERFRDKSRGPGGPSQLVFTAAKLFLIYCMLSARLIAALPRSDAVIFGYIGQLDIIVLGPICKLFRKPIMFNPLITLTDTIVEDRLMAQPGSVLARVIGLVDAISLRMADIIIADTAENAEYIHERSGVPRSQIRSIFVGADEGVFRLIDREHSRSALHVLFYGKMIPLHGVETILAAIELLNERGACDISFEIIGSGQQEHLIYTTLEAKPDLPVTYRPWVAYRRLPHRIASADVVLGIFGTGAKSSRVIPNKVFQAMAVGAPVVTRDSPAIRTVLKDGDSAMLVPAGNPEALAAAILDLRDPAKRQLLARNARKQFVALGSDEANKGALARILEELLPDLATRRQA